MSLTARQWEALARELGRVGAIHDAHDFAAGTLVAARNVVRYDQARLYYLDEHGQVMDEFLVGVSARSTKAYHQVYSRTDGGEFDVTSRAASYRTRMKTGAARRYEPQVMDWETMPHDSRFYREYAHVLGLRWCCGFCLYDDRDRIRATYSLDRLAKSGPFGKEELEALARFNELADDMFRNFFVEPPNDNVDAMALELSDVPLTPRERTVAALLMRGNTPKAAARTLGISVATVYKHVSNIHRKLGVSSELELMNRLADIAARARKDAAGPTVLPEDE